MLLDAVVPKGPVWPRSVSSVAAEIRRLLDENDLDLPLPGRGDTAGRWARLAALGRADLAVARIAEGHTDATAIIAEAGMVPEPGALYGVWAARSGGTGARLIGPDGRRMLTGTVRYCSGAHSLDRALVVATLPDDAGAVLVDVDVRAPEVTPVEGSWQAVGMDASDSADVVFHDVPVSADRILGRPGWYTGRRGFHYGGAGVAAVWFGGAAGVLDAVLATLSAPDEHQLAHVGTLHTVLCATDALLRTTADRIDTDPGLDVAPAAAVCRAAAEHAARLVVDLAPRITGPTPLSRDSRFPQRIADLQLYIRQHHAERDLAAIGRQVLDAEAIR